jgi:8-oxo-dGTP diphosphatase
VSVSSDCPILFEFGSIHPSSFIPHPLREGCLILSQFKFCPRCATPLSEQTRFGAVRQICPNCDFIFFADPKVVTVVLIEQAGKILLGKRNIEPGLGLWSFPSGYVNRGEAVELAAVREVKEETNLDVRLTGLLGVYSEMDNPIILIVYRAEIINDLSELQADIDEVSELAFFDLKHLPELAFPFDKRILEDWADLPFVPISN